MDKDYKFPKTYDGKSTLKEVKLEEENSVEIEGEIDGEKITLKINL